MLDIEPEEARLLLNTALMAIGGNRFQSADKILSALERFRPNSPELAVARATLWISMQDFQSAVEYIDRIGLVRFPDSAMLQAFKGMAYLRMDQRREAEAPLRIAANQTADPQAAQLAKDLLT